MSGWCPSSSVCGVLNGGGVCCCWPALSCAVVCALLIPVQCSSVLRSCAYCSLPGVRCSVGDCLSEVFVWWGILCPPSPLQHGGWGHCGWWGGVVWWGGIVLKGGRCNVYPPVCIDTLPFCSHGGPVEWRGVVCVVMPLSSYCPRFSHTILLLFCLVLPCLLWVGKCGGAWCE